MGDRWISKHFDAQLITPKDGEGFGSHHRVWTMEQGTNQQQFYPNWRKGDFWASLRQGDQDYWAWDLERNLEYALSNHHIKFCIARSLRECSPNNQAHPALVHGKKCGIWRFPQNYGYFGGRFSMSFYPRAISYVGDIEPIAFYEVYGVS